MINVCIFTPGRKPEWAELAVIFCLLPALRLHLGSVAFSCFCFSSTHLFPSSNCSSFILPHLFSFHLFFYRLQSITISNAGEFDLYVVMVIFLISICVMLLLLSHWTVKPSVQPFSFSLSKFSTQQKQSTHRCQRFTCICIKSQTSIFIFTSAHQLTSSIWCFSACRPVCECWCLREWWADSSSHRTWPPTAA